MTNLLRYYNRMPALLGWDPFPLIDPVTSFHSPLRIVEDADAYELRLDVPGVDPEHVDITLEQDRLGIRANRDGQLLETSVRLVGVDPDGFEASLDKGVLWIRAAKRPEMKPRKISLAVGSGTSSQKQLETTDAKS